MLLLVAHALCVDLVALLLRREHDGLCDHRTHEKQLGVVGARRLCVRLLEERVDVVLFVFVLANAHNVVEVLVVYVELLLSDAPEVARRLLQTLKGCCRRDPEVLLVESILPPILRDILNVRAPLASANLNT